MKDTLEMNLDEALDYTIKLHADYHNGKSGLSDKDFKDAILQIMAHQLKEAVVGKFGSK